MRAFTILFGCLTLLLAACSGGGNSGGSDSTATAAANIARARTATANAQSATPPASPSAASTSRSTATSAPPPTTATVGAPNSTPGPASPTSGPSGQLARIEQIETETAATRGLQPRTNVPETFITRDQLRANLEAELTKTYSPEQAKQDALVLWLFRLSDDRNLDLYNLQLNLLTEQVLGYYDDTVGDLYVLNTGGQLSALAQYTLSHEFVHALQDQNYDLSALMPENSTNSDSDLAASSLVEGDASLTSTNWAVANLSRSALMELANGAGSSSTVLNSAPAYVQQSLLFPYEAGMNFVTALMNQGGYAAVNAALADPPTSTEQILHPEKYLAAQRDQPIAVAAPDLSAALGPGWEQRDQDTLGEFDLRVLLEQNGATNAAQAAAGWGGSRYTYYENGSDGVVALTTAWDTPADADEFEAALRATLPANIVAANVWSVGGRFISVARQGDAVIYIAGTTQAAVEAALSAIG